MKNHIYIGLVKDNALVHLSVGDDGNLSLVKTYAHESGVPSVKALPNKQTLYLSTGTDNGAVVDAFRIDPETGELLEKTSSHDIAGTFCYLTTDPSENFLLGAAYGTGDIVVMSLSETGEITGEASLCNENHVSAHSIIVSPDNQHAYVPFVKDVNKLFQYHFDPDTGAMSPQDPAEIPQLENVGPRHPGLHPTKPFLYYTNEQHMGLSVYEIVDGSLNFHGLVKGVTHEDLGVEPDRNMSASDLVITPDGKFLFSGIRDSGDGGVFHDFILSYEIGDDGMPVQIAQLPCKEVPWKFTLMPSGKELLAVYYNSDLLDRFEINDDGTLTLVQSLTIGLGAMDVTVY
ncbi:MAG: beta-propeller fold lactonase family protein [Lentisphaeria bacterium]|nr:beta-propeller fold lactonase family protein [Lentisphaeria bacterium]